MGTDFNFKVKYLPQQNSFHVAVFWNVQNHGEYQQHKQEVVWGYDQLQKIVESFQNELHEAKKKPRF